MPAFIVIQNRFRFFFRHHVIPVNFMEPFQNVRLGRLCPFPASRGCEMGNYAPAPGNGDRLPAVNPSGKDRELGSQIAHSRRFHGEPSMVHSRKPVNPPRFSTTKEKKVLTGPLPPYACGGVSGAIENSRAGADLARKALSLELCGALAQTSPDCHGKLDPADSLQHPKRRFSRRGRRR